MRRATSPARAWIAARCGAQRSEPRGRRGIAAVEFAMTFPLAAMILLSSIEFGWYFSQLQMVNSACYDAARIGATEFNGVAAMATAEAAGRVLLDDMEFACGSGCIIDGVLMNVGGNLSLEVTMTVPYRQLTGILPNRRGWVGMMGFRTPEFLQARAVMPLVG